MTPLQQFNSMIQFYCTAHSGNAETTMFENNGRAVLRVDHSAWTFSAKVHQNKPKAELQFINSKEDTVDKSTLEGTNYTSLLTLILAFHWKCMSEVAN